LEENAREQLTKVSRGGKETTFGFDSKGLPLSIVSDNRIKLYYSFDSKGNLQHRTDTLTNQREQFLYDTHNRLTNWNIYQNNVLSKQNSIAYDSNTGNIVQKSDLNNLTMNYGGSRPHALTSISGTPGAISLDSLGVTYTDFKKIASLTEGNKGYTISYGVDEERRKSVYSVNGVVNRTRYYLGDYEEEVDAAGNIRKIHYLSGGAVYIQNSSSDSLLYGYFDYQGSLIALTDANGNVLERYAYDPWGQRRNPSDWRQTDSRTSWRLNRGYTGHEHLDAFGIINMNGRVYDPLTSMFFSPDPYVQAPDSWLNYNRYGYCLNNPLIYTDPLGEFIQIIVGAVIVGVINVGIKAYQGKINSFGDGIMAFGIGAVAGAVGVATGGAAFVSMGGAAGGAGGFLAGTVGGMVGSAASMPIQSICNSMYFGDPMMTEKQYLMGIGIGGLLGGIINGGIALGNGRSFWNGTLLPSTPTHTPLPISVPSKSKIQLPNNGRATPLEKPDGNSFTLRTTTTETPNYSIEGQSIKISMQRPDITGYDAPLAGKTDLYHNFPKLLDKTIVQQGSMAYRISDGSYMFTAPGTINNVQGVYTIGVNQSGVIYHRCFYEWSKFLNNY